MHKHNEHILYSKLFIEARSIQKTSLYVLLFNKDTKAGDEDK